MPAVLRRSRGKTARFPNTVNRLERSQGFSHSRSFATLLDKKTRKRAGISGRKIDEISGPKIVFNRHARECLSSAFTTLLLGCRILWLVLHLSTHPLASSDDKNGCISFSLKENHFLYIFISESKKPHKKTLRADNPQLRC